jgi:hypothetical protein
MYGLQIIKFHIRLMQLVKKIEIQPIYTVFHSNYTF